MSIQTDILNAEVVHREDLTPELAIIRVRPDSGVVPPFIPGQFCTLALPADPAQAPANAPARRRLRGTPTQSP